MIAVVVERRSKAKAGGAFLAVVADGSAEELGGTVRGAVEGGARLLTDGHKTYPTLARSGTQHVGQVQGDPRRAGEILPWAPVQWPWYAGRGGRSCRSSGRAGPCRSGLGIRGCPTLIPLTRRSHLGREQRLRTGFRRALRGQIPWLEAPPRGYGPAGRPPVRSVASRTRRLEGFLRILVPIDRFMRAVAALSGRTMEHTRMGPERGCPVAVAICASNSPGTRVCDTCFDPLSVPRGDARRRVRSACLVLHGAEPGWRESHARFRPFHGDADAAVLTAVGIGVATFVPPVDPGAGSVRTIAAPVGTARGARAA